MDDEAFNMSMRKYLKQVGVTSQQAIERHVREHGDVSGRLKVRTVLTIEGHGMEHVVEGEIDLLRRRGRGKDRMRDAGPASRSARRCAARRR